MKRSVVLLIIITLFISSCGKNARNNLDKNTEESKMVDEANIVNYLSVKDGTTINGKEAQSIEGNVYYIDADDNISKIDESTGEIKLVIDVEGKVVDFHIVDKRIFYYINNEGEYNLYFKDDLGEGDANLIKGVKSEFSSESSPYDNMVIDGDNIFYIENNKICKVNIAQGGKSELYYGEKVDLEAVIYIQGEKIYFTGNSGDKILLYSINVDDEKPEALADFIDKDLKFNNVCKFYNDSLYFVKKDSVSRLINIDSKGSKKTIFTGFDIEKFEIFMDNIYILVKKDSSNDLFVSNKKGETRLIESNINDFYVNDEGVFYIKINNESKWGINKASLKGENKELLALFDNGNISSTVANREFIYYTESNGGLFKYNMNTRDVIQLEDNISKLYKEGDSIVYEALGNDYSSIYLANVIGYRTENNIDETTIDDEEEEVEEVGNHEPVQVPVPDPVVVDEVDEVDEADEVDEVDETDVIDDETIDDRNDAGENDTGDETIDTDNDVVDEGSAPGDTDDGTAVNGEDTGNNEPGTVDDSNGTEDADPGIVDEGEGSDGTDDTILEEVTDPGTVEGEAEGGTTGETTGETGE